MVKSSRLCPSPRTSIDKASAYTQHYTGDRDNEDRRTGEGQNYWTGPESLECYTGRFLRDTMHGPGEYRWRHRGPDGICVTYEGNFFANRIHGYGVMSYPDGRVFNGLYFKNVRWGPGIQTHVSLKEDVGLWRGTQLIRLTWRPLAPCIAFDMTSTSNGRDFVENHRVVLSATLKTIGETNSALELLKQNGANSIVAVENWIKLYPKWCTDLESQLCYVDAFERCYYREKIVTLEQVANFPEKESTSDGTQKKSENDSNKEFYYAWNNDETVIHMMKHCYKHEHQRDKFGIELTKILSGQRRFFKPAGKHELDCRALLMASYLGDITNVAHLVNNCDVHPNVSDSQGNTAIMYAVCGDQYDVVHFLVEAGADVNSLNDSCCSALGLALIKYVCTEKNIPANLMVQALIPPPIVPSPPPRERQILEWNMFRDLSAFIQIEGLPRRPSKTTKGPSTKKIKSSLSIKDIPSPKKKADGQLQSPDIHDNESLESLSEEQRLYYNINSEYLLRVKDIFQITQTYGINSISYLFEVNDMIKEINVNEEDEKKLPDKSPKKNPSKALRDTIKPSKDIMWQTSDNEDYTSMDSGDKLKIDSLSHTMLTILKLLTVGADPHLVRCPQPALFIATISGSSELVRQLTRYGADLNETYPQTFTYTALDVAISLPYTFENVETIQALLECGAKADQRLSYTVSEANVAYSETLGPTLLHAALARKVENETEVDLRREVLRLLLEYKCNATLQFKGRSAIDVAMAKNMDIFNIFIKCHNTDLNAIINRSNQTILVKMFTEPFCNTIPSLERLPTLANLLLFGADPLLKCRNEDDTYENLFVFARKSYREMETSRTKSSATVGKADFKGKKPKKDDKLSTKSLGKMGSDETGDYKQAIDLVTECARLLHIRWLQSKLIKGLIAVINKYKHRQWNMILKEYKEKKCTGLWVTAVRCLEIWDILMTVKHKFCNNRILKHLLYIVHFCNTRLNSKPQGPRYMTAQEKGSVESEVNTILKEYRTATSLNSEMVPLKRPYVTPELEVKADDKFNVCFECALPFDEQKIVCILCKLIAFCSYECLRANMDRMNCHPCSDYIREIYFPSSYDASV